MHTFCDTIHFEPTFRCFYLDENRKEFLDVCAICQSDDNCQWVPDIIRGVTLDDNAGSCPSFLMTASRLQPYIDNVPSKVIWHEKSLAGLIVQTVPTL